MERFDKWFDKDPFFWSKSLFSLEVPVAGIEYDLEELASNWILRKSNLQILIQRLKEFYRSVLAIVIDPFLEGVSFAKIRNNSMIISLTTIL